MPITPLPCPKCGTYSEKATYCAGFGSDAWLYATRCDGPAGKDHFHRTCPDCGYTWITEKP